MSFGREHQFKNSIRIYKESTSLQKKKTEKYQFLFYDFVYWTVWMILYRTV